MKLLGMEINQKSLDMVANTGCFDDEIREKLHAELAPCTPEEFLLAYIERVPEAEEMLEELYGFER